MTEMLSATAAKNFIGGAVERERVRRDLREAQPVAARPR